MLNSNVQRVAFLKFLALILNYHDVVTREVIVVAGNFTLDGELVNLAEYDILSGVWSNKYEPALYLYGESNGVIWDISVNRSMPYNKLFVVGAFDTVAKTSQVEFCSVGEWDGVVFSKVGEGLCPRGDSSASMRLQTSVLGNDGDLFVGGSFESRVWNGSQFVNVYNIAHFRAASSSWLPLTGGFLTCTNCVPRVDTLSWDPKEAMLFIGGRFTCVGPYGGATAGLAMWTLRTGLVPFPGGGLTHDDYGSDGVALCIRFDRRTQSLFVAGTFHFVAGIECQSIAAWHRPTNSWSCLYEAEHAISTVTAMLIDQDTLYLAGWAAPSSSWQGQNWQAPYAIARLDLRRYLQLVEDRERDKDRSGGGGGNNNSGGGGGYNNGGGGNNGGGSSSGGVSEPPDRPSHGGNVSGGGGLNPTFPVLSPVGLPVLLPVPLPPTVNSSASSSVSPPAPSSTLAPTVPSQINYTDSPSERQEATNTSVAIEDNATQPDSQRLHAAKVHRRRLRRSGPGSHDHKVSARESRKRGRSDRGNSHSSRQHSREMALSSGYYGGSRRGLVSMAMTRAAGHFDLHLANSSSRFDTSLPVTERRLSAGRRRSSGTAENAEPSLEADVSIRAARSSGGVSISSGSNSTSSLQPGLSPTSAPSALPWAPKFEWLPGYYGGNGPILQLMPGSGPYLNCVFITGAFTNYPSVILWENSPMHGPLITPIGAGPGGSAGVRGLVTSIVQVSMPMPADSPSSPITPDKPSNKPQHMRQSTVVILILLACGLTGAGTGIAFAVIYNNRRYRVLYDQEADGDKSRSTIPLITLSGGGDARALFRECFEKAMQSRHLPTQDYLLMIDPKEIVLSNIIGEGSFGRVWSGRWGRNDVAVKEFVFAQAAIEGNSLQRGSIIEEIVGEACIMACLRHPKILQLYGCTLTMQAIWIVCELCDKGSLRMVLNNKNIQLPLIKKLSMCLDVADGMRYLHTRTPPIIHRDLKSHNLFVTEPSPGHYVAKIGDWGSARAVALSGAKSMTQGVGTACWLAPEVINFAHSSKASDIYAFGIVLWEVYTRQEVHEGLSAAQIIAKVAHEGLRPNLPRNCPWSKIMTDCWNENPQSRPDFQVIHGNLEQLYAAMSKKSGGVQMNTSTLGLLHPPGGQARRASTGSGTRLGGKSRGRSRSIVGDSSSQSANTATRPPVVDDQESFFGHVDRDRETPSSTGAVDDESSDEMSWKTLVQESPKDRQMKTFPAFGQPKGRSKSAPRPPAMSPQPVATTAAIIDAPIFSQAKQISNSETEESASMWMDIDFEQAKLLSSSYYEDYRSSPERLPDRNISELTDNDRVSENGGT